MSGKEAAPLTEATIKAKDLIYTTTADNGKEFSSHEKTADILNIFIYFAQPYHSWERDANENANRLKRIPQWYRYGDITPEQVMRVQNILHSRPGKRSVKYDSKRENLNN